MNIIIQDFSGIYDHQPFMQALRENATWLDCRSITGTDCYCDDDAVKMINEMIDNATISSTSKISPDIHFFDNGNYHYMSKLWTDRICEPFDLVVFDHHPDIQPPRFGGILSCGGWVLEVLENNKFIQNVIIIGVKDCLVDTIKAELGSILGESCTEIFKKIFFIRESELENRLPEFYQKYKNILASNIYISIDKDALSPTYAATNWDQGSITLDALKASIKNLAENHKILGIDICGERAHDFEGDEYNTLQEADSLNNDLNQELVRFFEANVKNQT